MDKIKQNIRERLIKISRDSSNKFENSKWPAPLQEEWRRTNLAKYNMEGFQTVPNNKNIMEKPVVSDLHDSSSITIRKFADRKTSIIVNETDAENIIIFEPSNPVELNEINTDLVIDLAEDAASRIDNKLASLALSSFTDTIFIVIPDNIKLDKPIILEFDTEKSGRTFLPNIFVYAGKKSQVKIIQKISSSDNSNVTGIMNIICEDFSNIHTATVTDNGSNTLIFLNRFFKLSKEATLSDFQSCVGGKLIKTRTEIDLSGNNADVRLYGAIFAEDNTQIDMRTVQHHMVKNCTSQALIKSVVKDKGRSIYQGLIEVEEDASLTDAYLTNHNLVLNNGARADSIPSLKIRNNDVKCSHGSTTGRVNEEQIFYLTSRGISPEEARQMILEGFFHSVYDNLTEDIKMYSSPLIMDKINQKEAV